MLEMRALSTPLIGPVNLSLAAGESLAIEGPSGSGKSLLLRALADLDPSEGEVLLEGRPRGDFPAPDWRRRVALVPAESGWWAERVGAHFRAEPDPAPVLDRLGLAGALGWEVARVSTGERARLALARALQMRPRVLLLDEPTAALDLVATEMVEALLAEEMAAGLALVLVTHDPGQAARLGARRHRMAAGRLEAVA